VVVSKRWAKLGPEDVEPVDWPSCLALLLESGGTNLLYRGQRLYEWWPATTLERELDELLKVDSPATYEAIHAGNILDTVAESLRTWSYRVERHLLHWFQGQARSFDVPNLPEATDRLGWWEIMQHHSVPTRLLDWTRSPFVALWFAFDGHEDGDGDAALWVLDGNLAMATIQSVLTTVSEESDASFVDSRTTQNRIANLAMARGLYVPILVEPGHTLVRSAAQQSVMTLAPTVPSAGAHGAVNAVVAKRVRLRESWKPEIARLCASLGYDRVSLYRSLDTLSGAFKSQLVHYFDGPGADLMLTPDYLTGLWPWGTDK